MNLAELLTIPAGIVPEQEILRSDDEALTYETLQQRVAGAASALTAMGVERGNVVAVLDINSPATIQVLYACAAIGAIFVPLNFRARVPELAHMLGSTSPAVVLAGAAYIPLAAEALATTSISPKVVDIKSILEVESEDWLEPVDTEDGEVAVLIFTSGTTAAAKAVMLGHGDLVNYVFGVSELADGDDHGAVLIAAPLHHVAGLSAILTATWAGRRIVLMSQFDAGEWLRLVDDQSVTHGFLVPTMLKRVLEHERFTEAQLSTLQVLSYGAAPAPMSVVRRAISTLPESVQLVNAFGQTETTSTVTMLGPDDHRLTGDPAEDEKRLRRLASIGKPLPEVTVTILGEDGQELPAGRIGELAIGSNRIMRGYFGQEEATRATIQDGLLRTRDLGWIDEDGYVFLAGRKSDMIIRGGENIAPEEIEIVLESHMHVEEAAVVGEPNEEWGEIVVAAVVSQNTSDDFAQELMQLCRERLGRYKAPQKVLFIDSLPRNDLGKVLRKDLRQRLVVRAADVRA